MKHTATKIMSILLATLMLLTLAAPLASATEGTSATPTYPTYAEAQDGDLLYKVDFSGTDGRYTPAVKTGLATFSVDPSDDTKATLNAQADADGNSFGGPISGLPLNENSVYTIEFTVTKASADINWGAFVYVDAAMQKGFGFAGNQASISSKTATNLSRPDWRKYGDAGLSPKIIEDATNGTKTMDFKIELDAPNHLLRFFIKKTDGNWAVITRHNDFTVTTAGELNIAFGSLDKAATFADVKIFKGRYNDGAIKVNKPGQLLLAVTDITQAQEGTNGVTYTPNLNHFNSLALNYSYNAESDTHTITTPENLNGKTGTMHGMGGNTNLRLGEGQQYTITYTMKVDPGAGGMGIRYCHSGTYGSTQGSYFNNNGYAGISGGGSAGIHGSVVNTGAAPYSFQKGGYNNVAIEIDGYNVAVYLEGVQVLSYSALNNNKVAKGFSSDLLSINMVNYDNALVASAYIGEYKDIKVYSGLTISNNYVQVTDNGVTETVAIEGDSYVLPSMKKVGYVFNGWKVNGAETVTAAGTTITTEGLSTLETVYTKVMSENFYQFRAGENGKKDIRIVSVIDSLAYGAIGYNLTMKFTVNGQEKTVTENMALKNVYTSLTAKYGAELVTLETLGFDKDGGYLTSFVIGNLPTDIGTLTVEFTPYQLGVDATEPTVGETVTVVFDLANETVTR